METLTDAQRIEQALSALEVFETHPNEAARNRAFEHLRALLTKPESQVASERSLLEVIKQMKLRLCFSGWPAESYWEAHPGTWVPDWRKEAHLIDHALHGTELNEHLWNNPPSIPFHQIPKTVVQ